MSEPMPPISSATTTKTEPTMTGQTSLLDMPLLAPLAPPKAEAPEAAKQSKAAQAYRTISEVAEELDLPQHVLRFWETKFSQIRPMKRAGGRRFYRPEDVELLRLIKGLLHQEGYTIKGVQKVLKQTRGRLVLLGSAKAAANAATTRAARKHLTETPSPAPVAEAPKAVASVPSLEQAAPAPSLDAQALRETAERLRALEARLRSLL